MKKVKIGISVLLLLPFLLTACVREVWPGGGSGEVVISFGSAPSADVVVSTKGTLKEAVESRVHNIYVFVFDGSGVKIFGRYFDATNLDLGSGDYWTLNDAGTAGTIHIKTTAEDGCTIGAISNIDAEMVNISPEQLGTVETLSDLQQLKATLNQLTLSRSGYFPMSGTLTGANLASGTWTNENTLSLRRLDAKVQFLVQVDESATNIYDFTPQSWQVINVPKTSYVLEKTKHTLGSEAAVSENNFFDTDATVFETEELTSKTYCFNTKKIRQHGFSFYMMENRKAPKATPAGGEWKYTDRDLQNKDSEGKRNTGGFKYADDLATYVIIKGRLELKEDASSVSDVADVQYVIHLGDFGKHGTEVSSDNSDFDVERNHSYLYKIFIKGVTDITAEAINKTENEPGATGEILVSSGEVLTCDSHYSSHALMFNINDIVPAKMNWWVQTPFNPDGADANSEGFVDFDWVEFRVNDQPGDKDSNGKYLPNRWTVYKPIKDSDADKEHMGDGKTMTIRELLSYLQKAKNGEIQPSPFDSDGNIAITAFVNEFYYEKDPRTGDYKHDLWTEFVDKPMRTMCILSDIKHSDDDESYVINSSFTIQQHAIQSVYNVNNTAETNLQSAWGCEYDNDARESICQTYWKNRNNDVRGNSDLDNGRLDSMIEWGLMGTTSNRAYVGDNTVDWGTYLNLTDDKPNISLMNTDSNGESYAYLRYSCLSRNRDNDGDGKIDKDEIRWYMATSNQLIGLFLGSQGIEGAARLYHPTQENWTPGHTSGSYANNETWRQHYLGSNCEKATSNSNDYVRIVWAEEGLTGSTMNWQGQNDQTSVFSVRCVRNLGYDPAGDSTHGYDITYSDENKVPDPLIVPIRRNTNQSGVYEGTWDNYSYYEVDCRRVNERSLRYYTDRELVRHDENSEAARLYRRFVTAPKALNVTVTSTTISKLNSDLDNGDVICCPEGYRLPNIRELGVISYFFDSGDVSKYTDQKNAVARTYFSFGYDGLKFAPDNHWGWAIRSDKSYRVGMVPNTQSVSTPRCVKDVKD